MRCTPKYRPERSQSNRRQQEGRRDGEKGRQRAREGEMEEERGGTRLKREGERSRGPLKRGAEGKIYERPE